MAFSYVGQFLILRKCMLKYIVVKCHICNLHSNGSEDIYTYKEKEQKQMWQNSNQ